MGIITPKVGDWVTFVWFDAESALQHPHRLRKIISLKGLEDGFVWIKRIDKDEEDFPRRIRLNQLQMVYIPNAKPTYEEEDWV